MFKFHTCLTKVSNWSQGDKKTNTLHESYLIRYGQHNWLFRCLTKSALFEFIIDYIMCKFIKRWIENWKEYVDLKIIIVYRKLHKSTYKLFNLKLSQMTGELRMSKTSSLGCRYIYSLYFCFTFEHPVVSRISSTNPH